MNDKDQKQNSVQTEPSIDIHDRVAEAYYGLMGQQFMRETQDRIHWICRHIQGKNVLDVGCSQGIVPILIAREGLKAIGIDSSPKAIDEATKYLENEPKQVRKHVSFVNADFLSWDHHDVKKVDTVVMSEVLEHLTRPESFLETAARILPKKGRLIVTVPFGINDFIDHKHTFYLLEPLRLISKHFDVIEIEILGKWLGIVADRRTAVKSRTEPFQPTIAVMEKLEGAFGQTERVLRDELTVIRKKLEEANQKYRGVTEQFSTLRQRMTEEEKARQVTEQSKSQVAEQLKQTQCYLQEEQAALQQQVAQLSQQEHAHSAAADEAAKNALRLKIELEAMRGKLEETTQKYRVATEQVSTFKQRVTEEERARQAGEEAQAQATSKLKAELEAARGRLEEANQKYRGVTEQVAALKQQVAQEEAVHGRLEEANQKYRGAIEQVTALKQRVTEEERALKAGEQAQAQATSKLKAELEAMRGRLEEANQKYRAANEQISTLKQRVTQEEAMQQGAEKARAQAATQLAEVQRSFQEERKALQQQLAQLSQEGQAKTVTVHEGEKKLIRLEAELEARSRLDDANQKYQAATEQVSRLTQQAKQEEATRKTVEQALQAAEKKLTGLDAELAAVRTRLEEANQKYRGATEQVSTLKQRVVEEEKARQIAELALAQSQIRLQEDRTALQQQIAQLREEGQAKTIAAHEAEKQLIRLEAELEAMRGRWEEANQKYRGATEQVSTLKQRVIEEEKARQAVELALAQATSQLETELMSGRGRLEEANQKYRGVTEQVSTLKQRVIEEEKARQAVELALAQATSQLETELMSGRGRLEEANQKYRGVTEQVSTLKQRVIEEEKARQAVELALAQATSQLETELMSGRGRLEEANQKYRGATEQVSTLKQQVVEEEKARQAAELALAQATRELVQSQARLQNERTALQQQIAQLGEEGQAKTVAAHEAEQQLVQLEAELEAMRGRLEEANQKYRGAIEQVSTLKQRVTQEETARQLAEQGQRQAVGQLEQANLKYRLVTAEQIPELKNKLETQYSKTREGQHALEQLRLDLRKDRKTFVETARQLEQVRQQKKTIEHQLVKTRGTMSFQFGYLLIHGFKSVNGFLSLPTALWALRKEAIQRRKKKAFLPSPPKPPSSSEPPFTPSQPIALIETLSQEPPSNGHAILAETAVSLTTLCTTAASHERKLNIACIMDEFTFSSYQPEAVLHQLTPANWRAELEGANPDLLFIESAWRGKDELWGNKVGHTSVEVQGIVEWCGTKQVPTVFWCKEDPIHFETFLNTAKLFDYVFTTDIDCIHRYKAALGHDRVYLLPFACQPATTNPIETYPRKDAFCFAGAYYVRYPDRTRDLGNFVMELPAFRPLEIYDRNYGKNDPNYQFPEEYRSYIVGTLPFDQIDKAYKGYRYAINLNSIKQSQSMFARRVFELLASNTITISNFSRGVRLLFGDLVITSDSGHEIVRRLHTLADNEAQSRKLRLAALRKVMREHTYGQRLAYVVSKVSGQAIKQSLPHIAVLAHAESHSELGAIQSHYQRQRYANSSLYVVVGEGMIPPVSDDPRVHLLKNEQAKRMVVDGIDNKAELIAGMVVADYYGPNYLEDIALATRYTQAELIGKAARYTWEGGRFELKQPDEAYHHVQSLPARAAAIRRQTIANENVLAWAQSLGTRRLQADQGLAIDEFNYCEQGAAAESALVREQVDDLPGLNTGLSIDHLLERAERIAPESNRHDDCPRLTGKQVAEDFGKSPSGAITLAVDGQSWLVGSTLSDGKHEYLYATVDHSPAALGFTDHVKVYLDVTPGLNIQLVIQFLDAQKQKISHVIQPANRNQEAVIPVGTEWIRFGLRFYAGGHTEIKGLVLGHRNLQPAEILSQAEQLLLTNQYPSYSDLYRNGFVHTRVRAYQARGVRCDVFRLRPDEAVSYHEFEDVNVVTGSQEVLHQMLSSGRYKSVLVHFLDAAMWEVLQHHVDRVKVLVWVHGAEIQPLHRREFDHQTQGKRAAARRTSDERMAFWRALLQPVPPNLKLIFVSRYFAEEVMQDLGFRIPEKHYTIIHNPINTELFGYQEKSVEQRKKVLSIRPYASAKYANDLSVKAIQRLSQEPWFYHMEFRMIGDGSLFEETIAPLREFRNVYIEQRFLNQQEIAALHKEYGIFLCPTRMDAQGVSRDEAMASGLVPVTNAVTAIPEFVDDRCGILAPGEDAEAMARGIALLYEHPERFAVMSAAAATRVREQSDAQRVIDAELAVVLDDSEQIKYRVLEDAA